MGGVELDRLGVVDNGVLEAAQLAEGEAPAHAVGKAVLVRVLTKSITSQELIQIVRMPVSVSSA